MSTTGQSEAAQSSHKRGSSACLPLIDAATKDLFRKNAFRITGLPVDATTREMDRHAGKIKMLAEFGHAPDTAAALFAIKPPPSLDDIRDAIQKIKDPEKRLIDEFFWFWPEEFGKSQSDPAFQALEKGDVPKALEIWTAKEKSASGDVVASHNLALVHQISALDWELLSLKKEVGAEQRKNINENWKDAFKRWKTLTDDERFWEKVTARIRQLNEPNLPTGFARRMRATLPEALDKINAELAVAFAESGKIEIARLHIGFLRGPEQRQDKIEKIAELVLTPVSNRLKEQIKSARDRGEKNPPEAAKVALELLQQSRQTLTLFDLFFGKDNELRNDLFDEVASACNRLQVVYHEATRDEKTSIEILNSVLSLATAIELRQQIEKNIGTLTGFIADKKLEPVYALLKLIQDSKDHPRSQLGKFNNEVAALLNTVTADLPRGSENRNQLFDSAATVLRGISLEAWNKHHDKTTAVTANKLALEFACDPILKQRLQEDQTTLMKFSNPFGDAGGEHTRMERGQYDSMIHVAIAFAVMLVFSGIMAMSFITNILKISCDDTTSLIVGGVAGAGIALLVFWNRWKCIEAFSSQASCGITNISILYVPIVALFYANWRGVKKVGDTREWENTGANKSIRFALAASAIVLIFGIVGEWRDVGASNSTSYTPPIHDSPPPKTATVYTPPAPSAPAYTPPSASDGGSSGKNVYRVPSDISSQLDREKVGIEADRAVLKQLDDQLDSLGREIESDRIYLDKTSQYAVDAFNAKVDRYNTLSQQDKAETAAFNERVDNYNAKLRQNSR
jgi:hypothetical protein